MPKGVYVRTEKHKETIRKYFRINHPWNYHIHLSKKHKERISRGMPDQSGKANPMYGRGYLISGERHADVSGENHPFFNHHHSKEARERIGIATGKRMRKLWEDPAFAKNIIEKIAISNGTERPNRKEGELNFLLNLILVPELFRYVGDGSRMIGRKNPDFIRTDGVKQIVELFGIHWHKRGEGRKKIRYYKKYGYDCLIIWEKELKRIEKLSERILRFAA